MLRPHHLSLAFLLLAACDGDAEPELRVAQVVSLGEEKAATLAIDPAGGWWLGLPGALLVRDSAGAERRLELPMAEPPEVVGWSAAGAYLRRGDSVAVAAADGDSVRALRAGFGGSELRLDRRGRALFQGAGTGAVLLHDPATLEPVSAWAAIGRRTTAIALSPEGDRLYQAVEADGDAAILIRDLQTGRIVAEAPVDQVVQALEAGDAGMLYGAFRTGRAVTAEGWRVSRGEMESTWRSRHADDDGAGGLKLRYREGVLGLAAGGRVRLLDAADGSLRGRAGGEPLDFDLSPDGALWVLYAGEVRRLE